MRGTLRRTVALVFPLVLAALGAAGAAGARPAQGNCPDFNPPTTLALVAGAPQTAKLGAAFATDLAVELANPNGCPITTPLAGVAVTFTAPAGGPSGAFSANGSNAVVVGTDASGVATAPQFTANELPGGYTVVASSDLGSVGFFLVNTAADVPASATPLSPPSQSATVGASYGQPLAVEVMDANGSPVGGARVTFTLGSGSATSAGATFAGGSAQATETTTAAGLATSPRFQANAAPGRFAATAAVAGLSDPVNFSLDNLAVRPPVVRVTGGSRQSATVGRFYRRPLQVRVTDARGRPLQGLSVTFTLGSGSAGSAGATFAGGSAQAAETTTAAGLATSPRFQANAVPGRFAASATVAGVTNPAGFALDNLAGPPPRVRVVGGSRQSAMVGRFYRLLLRVRVTDARGRPLQGLSVTFTLGSGSAGSAGATFAGGSAQAAETTNAAGVATSPRFQANTVPGRFRASAAVPGVTNPAGFALDNLAARPPVVRVTGGSRQSATVGSFYRRPLQVRVTDAAGAPVQGLTVTFTLGSGSAGSAGATFAGGSAQAETTNAAGVATSPRFQANAVPGRFAASAAVPGVTNPASFPLDNLAARPPVARSVGAAAQSATVEASYRRPLQVRVTDAAGRPLQGLTVTFALGSAGGGASGSSAGAGATFAGGLAQAAATTNSAGIATSPRFRADTVAGRFTGTAVVAGVTDPVAFPLENLPGKPASVTAGAAASESTTAGTAFPIRLAVTVTDRDGNATAGVLAVFAAPARGPSGSFAGPHGASRSVAVETNASGIAVAPVLIANRERGGYVVTASVAGAPATAFALVNRPPGSP